MSDSFIERHIGAGPNDPSKSTNVPKSKEKLKPKPSSHNMSPKSAAAPPKSTDSPMFSKKNSNGQTKTHPGIKANGVATSQTISPRKTRSGLKRDATEASTSGQANEKHHSKSGEKSARTKERLCTKVPQMDGASDKLTSKSATSSKKAKVTTMKSHTQSSDDSDDSDFAPSPPKRIRAKATSAHFVQPKKPKSKVLEAVKRVDLRVLSTDDDDEDVSKTLKTTKITALDTWIEAYNEKDKKWIVIDPVRNKVDAVEHIRVRASNNRRASFE